MADEETQRIMRFILEQQAQLTATVGSLSETVGRISETVERLSEKVDRTADGISSLLAIAEIHEREISELRESVSAVDVRGRETDERLNALINTVERYISERRNGQA
jgi:methyl-accepting chemotaxis protein